MAGDNEKRRVTFQELDALNVMLRWFGGKMNALDASVASISRSIFRDLEDSGYVRKRWIGWEITRKGRQALADNNINAFTDTRRY